MLAIDESATDRTDPEILDSSAFPSARRDDRSADRIGMPEGQRGGYIPRPPWSREAGMRAVLAVAEAANAHLDLSRLLEVVAATLEALVPVDTVAVIAAECEAASTRGVYLRSSPRVAGEAEARYIERVTIAAGFALAAREMRGAVDRLGRERATIVFEDARGAIRLPFADHACREDRTVVLIPLTHGGTFVGGLVFARAKALPFAAQEVRMLEQIATPLGSAAAHALACDEVRRLRARLREQNAPPAEFAPGAAASRIIGSSPGLQRALDRVACVAGTGATVLVTGETGTGKELIARAIHAASPRAKRPLISVNCAALPEGLVASELFGHERGAFTGALERRRGRFELASGGTIFLDEIGELPPATQVALLRVLQEGEFERVGGTETLRTDARVVAATNRSLEEAVAEGRFRSDLFFRLNCFPISVPPLRMRTEDIPALALH
jgi:formate hydrogenlyase transcriptional activator